MNQIDFSDGRMGALYWMISIVALFALSFTAVGYWAVAAALWALTAFGLSIPSWYLWLLSLSPDGNEEEVSCVGLTEEETRYYFRHNGTRCPFCYSAQLEAGPIEVAEIEPDDARQEVWCLESDCGAVWVDEYKLNSVAVRYGPKDGSS